MQINKFIFYFDGLLEYIYKIYYVGFCVVLLLLFFTLYLFLLGFVGVCCYPRLTVVTKHIGHKDKKAVSRMKQ